MKRLIDILFFILGHFRDIIWMSYFFHSFMTFSRRLFLRYLFVDIGRVQQNVYFTTVGISFLCWNNPISTNLFQQLQNKRFIEYSHYYYWS